MIYLDNAATTRPYDDIIRQMPVWLSDYFANPSSGHPEGIKSRELIESSRQTLANIFDVPKAGVIFCGSGTESDNLAIKGVLNSKKKNSGNIILSKIEHAAVLKTASWAREEGFEVRFAQIDPNSGQVDHSHLETLIDKETHLVSIQHVNSETGVVQDLATISRIIKATGLRTIFHSDGVQAFGKVPVNLGSLGVDLYSISGHKFHSIRGAGALIRTKDIPLTPLHHGGGQEFGFRSGTENTAAIAALSVAAQKAVDELASNIKPVTAFSDRFKALITKKYRQITLFNSQSCLPHIINLSIKGVPGEVLRNHLAEEGILISTGSACGEKSNQLSPALQAFGFSHDRIRGSVRISVMKTELPEDFDGFTRAFFSVVDQLLLLV